MIRIGLVGDFDRGVLAHRAIPLALELAAASSSVALRYEWVPTETIAADARLSSTFDGLWCVPASPYRSQEGALAAIRIARETPLPFLGTCGGFQHAILEYARNVLGWSDAVHGEEAPAGGGRAVIAELRCALVEEQDEVRLIAGTKIADAYGTLDIREGYHCRYGINLEFASLLERGPLRATAHDHNGEIRAVELDGHPFFAATLFQPERAALTGQRAPLVDAFVNACR